MFHHRLDIQDLYDIEGRDTLVLTRQACESLPSDLALKVGDPLEIHLTNGNLLRTSVAGLEMMAGMSRAAPFGFLVGDDLISAGTAAGAEVWVGDGSIRHGDATN